MRDWKMILWTVKYCSLIGTWIWQDQIIGVQKILGIKFRLGMKWLQTVSFHVLLTLSWFALFRILKLFGGILSMNHFKTYVCHSGSLLTWIIECLTYSGCLILHWNSSVECYKRFQAHPSNMADPKVFQAMRSLPSELGLEVVKRGMENNTWPRSFNECPPTSAKVGMYFFADDTQR